MDESRKCADHYTVKRGDSFYLIAHRLGVPLRDLLEANPDIPPARLMVGDVLCIPQCGGDTSDCPSGENGGNAPENGGDTGGNAGGNPAACPANRRAVVQDGQTLSDLQLRYNLSYHTLKAANPETDLEGIKGGDVVCIPECSTACPLPSSVVLGLKDTLESVAVTYNLPIAAILRANPCLAPEDFKPGVTIRLPD